MEYKSKQALIQSIRAEHDALCALLAETSGVLWRERGVWGDDWTIHDLVAHLAEWQSMFLGWYRAGAAGARPEMPAPGYTWRETPKLNRAIWAKHHRRDPSAVRAEFDAGYEEILALVKALSPERLLTPGHFEWTGAHPLTTYLGANTASHYRFAIKVIGRWRRRRQKLASRGSRGGDPNHAPRPPAVHPRRTDRRPVRAVGSSG